MTVVDQDSVRLNKCLVGLNDLPQRVVGDKKPVHLADPVAGRRVAHIGREYAEITARRRRHRHDMGVDEIDIGEVDIAGIEHQRKAVVLIHFALVDRRRDHRRIVRPGDGDGDLLRDRAALPVVDGHGVNLCQLLAFRQKLHLGIVDREIPHHLAGAVAGRVVAQTGGEAAEIPVLRRCHRNTVRVAEIGIAEIDGARRRRRRRILYHVAGIHGSVDNGNGIGRRRKRCRFGRRQIRTERQKRQPRLLRKADNKP